MTQRQAEILDAVGKFSARVGVPACVLAAVLGMIWTASSTLHESVVVPVVTAHTEFIAATQKTQERQAETLEAMASAREQQTQILHEIAEGQREIHKLIGELPRAKEQP